MGDQGSITPRPVLVEDDQPRPMQFDEASAEERKRVRCRAASRLLWSRLSELEELRNQLSRLSEAISVVSQLQNKLVDRVEEQMAEIIECATTTPERQEIVGEPFSIVLTDAIRRLRD